MITPDLQSCFPFLHQLFDKPDHTPRYSDPFVLPYHSVMVNFGIYLFVVIKGYCQVAMMLPDLLHDTSVADELTKCAQYLSHISFTAVCSRVFCHQAHQDLICVESCNWTLILFIAKIFCF